VACFTAQEPAQEAEAVNGEAILQSLFKLFKDETLTQAYLHEMDTVFRQNFQEEKALKDAAA
jgi:hypothetical protein